MASAARSTDPRVDAAWIAAHVDDPAVRLIEVDVSRATFAQGHIPGAILWDAYVDLRDAAYRPLSAGGLRSLLAASGITPDATVVFYGYAAPLGLWLLTAHGHERVRVLPGPRDQWTASGRPWSTAEPDVGRSAYPPLAASDELLATRQAVEDAIDDPAVLLLDVRSDLEYSGERFWPSGATAGAGRAGHVPGAVSVPIDALRGEDGSPKSAEQLRPVFAGAGVTPGKRIITYCTIGNRASEAWFDLKYTLGYPRVAVYYDSWAVWGKEQDTPVAG
jgi:thiosulfate/3-mercaptopyruvate sulfurtransferase